MSTTKIQRKDRTLAPKDAAATRRKFLTGAAGAVAGGAALVAAPNVSRAETVTLKMQGSWGKADIFNEMAQEYVPRVLPTSQLVYQLINHRNLWSIAFIQ